MTINEKIYKMRIDLGLSQKEFAEKVGTSQAAINFWENGKRQPRISQIKKIASAFKLPLYALTDDDFEIWDVSNELENKKDYKTFFLGEKFRKLVNKFTGYYSMLNEEGRKKADKEISSIICLTGEPKGRLRQLLDERKGAGANGYI